MGKDKKYFGGLINILSLKRLFQNFSKITGLCIGIYEYPKLEKNIIASENTKLCSNFFRASQCSLNHCNLNQKQMIDHIIQNKVKTVSQECPFGFMSACSPIYIDNECIAVLMTGQALINKHSEEKIQEIAKTYNFDLEKFREEVNNTRIISKQEFDNIKTYQMQLAEMISEMGTSHKRVLEKEAQLKKQNKELLNISNELLFTRFSVDHSEYPIFWIDKNSNVIDVNYAACKHLGYEKEEILNMNVFDIEIAFKKQQWPKILKTLTSMKNYTFEGIHKKKDGTLVPVEIKSVYQKFKDKEHMVCFVNDITEKKQLQEELDNEKRNLEQAVVTRTMELQQSLEELEKANQLKSQFISSVSHELRTPLNAIIGFADILNKEYFGNLNEKQLEYIELISNSGAHLLNLINEILDISRIDAGEATLMPELINYSIFISDIKKLFRDQYKRKEVNLRFFNPDNVKTIYADKKKLKQILINLLSNSLKFTDKEGNVSLTIREFNNNDLVFSISDTGMGIKQDDLENIFIDFFQTEDVRTKALGGTGIGLALTRRLIELHGGKIGAESTYGKGSTFWFSIPAKQIPGNIKLAKKAIKA